MKLKRLTTLLTALSFIGQTFILSGCVGNQNNNPNDNANLAPKQASANLKDATASLDDHRLWGNLTAFDDKYIDYSNLDLAIDNNSNNDLEIVGCEDDSGYSTESPTLLTVEAHQAAARTPKFDTKWSAYADSDGRILDPSHIEDNKIETVTEGVGTVEKMTTCYYRVYHPEAGDFLYFKLNVQNETLPTTGRNTTGQPDNDMQKVANSDVGKALKTGQLSLTQLTDQMPWANQKDAQLSLDDYTDIRIVSGVQNTINKVNQIRIANKPFYFSNNSDMTPEQEEILDEYRDMGIDFETYKDVQAFHNMQPDFKFSNGKIYVELNHWSKNKEVRILLDLSDPNDAELFQLQTNSKLISNENILDSIELSNSYENDHSGQAPQTAEEVLEEETGSEAEMTGELDSSAGTSIGEEEAIKDVPINVLKDRPDFTGNPVVDKNIEEAMSRTGGAPEIAEAMMTERVIAGVSLVTVAALTLWQLVSLIQNDSDGASTDYKGNHTTKINMVTLDVPSDADVASWNAAHPDKPIAANTKASPPNPDDANGGNNATSQSMRFTFKDATYDQQIGTAISLSSITTPWRRQGAQTEDPFLGKLHYGDVHPNSGNVGDAVVNMTVSDIANVTPIKDAEYAYNSQNMANLGLSSLAQDLRYAAPVYNMQKIVNVRNNRLMYGSGMNGGLYNSSKGLVKINGIEGIVLNKGQQTTLNVQIPASSAKNGLSYGAGFGANLIEEDSSGSSTHTPVKSDLFMLNGKNDDNTVPYFYNKFNCSFPTKVGDSCPFTMMVGGYDNKKHMEKLYLADGNSKTSAIPVYVNYNLVSDPVSSSITQGVGDQSFVITLKNFSSSDYKTINVSGLPDGAILDTTRSTCGTGLKSNETCSLVYDASQVGTGSYDMIVYGSDGVHTEVPSADSADANSYSLTVQGGF